MATNDWMTAFSMDPVTSAYRNFLGREPDPEGYANWKNAVNTWSAEGQDIGEMLRQAFESSEEFQMRNNPAPPPPPTFTPPPSTPTGTVPPAGWSPPTGPPTDATPWMPNPGAGITPGFDMGNFDFNMFDLPQYTGPFAAPITEGMFGALQGIKNTANANPIGMSSDIMRSISAMLSGEGFAAGGMDPNQIMSQFRPNTGFTQTLNEAARTGFQPNVKFNPSNLSGVFDSIEDISSRSPDLNFSNTRSAINTARNAAPDVNFSGAKGVVNAVRDTAPRANFSRLDSSLNNIQGGVPGTNTRRSDALINDIVSGRANNNVDSRMRGFQNNLLKSHRTALDAPRFDNTALFNDLKTVFESDLEDQTAELQEQFSGLGLGVGASDRLDRIASNAGEARAKFGVGMGNLARDSFEAAENRRLGAIGAAGGTADVLNAGTTQAASMLQAVMSNERLPMQERLAIRDQIISTLPLEFQRSMAPVETEMQRRQQVLSTLPAELQMSLTPAELEMQRRGQVISTLPTELQMSLAPAELEMQRRAQVASTLPTQMAAASQPFAEQMQFLESVVNPAAQRRMSAAATGAQLDENAMQRYMEERARADRAREAALSAGVATRGQDIEQRGQGMQAANNLFNAESVLRSAADDEALRAYQEFVRTQGGGLEQMLAFLNSLPEGTVAVGPSTASQVGTVAGQVVQNLPELIQTGQVIWDAARGIWDWATK